MTALTILQIFTSTNIFCCGRVKTPMYGQISWGYILAKKFVTFCNQLWALMRAQKSKIMRKYGIHNSVPCRDSTLEQFLFYRVSRKNAKSYIFWRHCYSTIHLSKQHFCHKREAPRNIMFSNFFGHPAKQKLF